MKFVHQSKTITRRQFLTTLATGTAGLAMANNIPTLLERRGEITDSYSGPPAVPKSNAATPLVISF